MEILKILAELMSGEKKDSVISLLNALKNNSFNLKETLKNIKPETLAPLFKTFAENQAKTETFSAETSGVAPIANIADKEIVYALNRYVSAKIF